MPLIHSDRIEQELSESACPNGVFRVGHIDSHVDRYFDVRSLWYLGTRSSGLFLLTHEDHQNRILGWTAGEWHEARSLSRRTDRTLIRDAPTPFVTALAWAFAWDAFVCGAAVGWVGYWRSTGFRYGIESNVRTTNLTERRFVEERRRMKDP